MHNQSEEVLEGRFRAASEWLSAAVFFGGLLAVSGWIFGIETLKSPLSNFITIKLNASISFVLIGAALWLMQEKRLDRRNGNLAFACVVPVVTVALLTLAEYLFGWDFKIDQFLIKESANAVGIVYPNRMAPNAAIGFILAGTALLLADWKPKKSCHVFHYLAVAQALVTLISILGYLYGIKSFYGIAPFTPVSIYALLFFILTFFALIFSRPACGIMSVISSATHGGWILRRTLLPLILLPIVTGWLGIANHSAGWLAPTVGFALLAVTNVFIMGTLIYVIAKALHETDMERMRTAENLRENKERLEAVLNNSSNIINVKDMEGRYLLVNSGYEKFFKTTSAQMLGKSVDDVYPKAVADRLRENDRKAVEAGRAVELEEEIVWEGKRYFFLSTKAPLYDASGKPYGVCVIATDITERKNDTDRALREQEKRFRDVFEGSAMGIILLDHEGFITDINPAGEQIFGYADKEILGMDYRVLVHPEYRSESYKRFLGLQKGEIKRTRTVEQQYIRKNGGMFWGRHVASVLNDENGDTQYVTIMLTDISDVKNAEESLRRTEEQLRQSQKIEAIGLLAGGIAHDFNNILTVVQGNLDVVLKETPKESHNAEALEEALSAVHRAAELTRQFLAFSRQQPLDFRSVPINQLIEGMKKMLSRVISEDMELAFLPDENAGSVEADSGSIEQVILNLSVNARDAMPNGGKLTIETKRMKVEPMDAKLLPGLKPGEYVMVSVSDTGVGMTEEVKERLFEPFFTTKERGKGTGLGLSVVFGIVEQHRGHIQVHSQPGRGTAFHFYIPSASSQTGEAKQEPSDLSSRMPVGHETVLLVEDNLEVRKFTVRCLEQLGYKTLAVDRPESAVGIVKKKGGGIDLLLSDVVMPGMNGRDLLESVRAVLPEIRILFISGYPDKFIGANDPSFPMLPKPFTIKELAFKIREVLDKPAQ